jgi:hypothetical protein
VNWWRRVFRAVAVMFKRGGGLCWGLGGIVSGLKRVIEAIRWQNKVERLVQYTERHFENYADWPSVRKAARALKVSQTDISLLVDDSDELCLESYNVSPPEPLGDHAIYSRRGSIKKGVNA